MAERTQRLHVLLNEEEMELLKATSVRMGRPVGELVREALGAAYRFQSPLKVRAALTVLKGTSYIEETDWSGIRARLYGGA